MKLLPFSAGKTIQPESAADSPDTNPQSTHLYFLTMICSNETPPGNDTPVSAGIVAIQAKYAGLLVRTACLYHPSLGGSLLSGTLYLFF